MQEQLDPIEYGDSARAPLHSRIRARLAARYRRIGDEPVDDLGIPVRIIHRVLTAIFAVIGANILLLSFTSFGGTLANPWLRAISAAALILSPLWIIVGRRVPPHSHRTMRHIAAIFGTFIFCFAAQYTGDLRGALLATMLVSPIIAATAMPKREAIPYVIVGAGAILVVGLYSHEYGSALRAIVLLLVTLSAGTMVIATRQQLVNVLNANRDLSETDPLTGAANVRSLAARLRDECERSSRLGTEFAVAQFDLDEFKLVNDRHSHSLGDAVLVATARAIMSELTEADLVVRRGGDEFIAILPAADKRDVSAIVAACAEAIRRARLKLAADITPTASSGWARHEPGETPEELLTRLDAELHESKALAQAEAARQGRGRNMPSKTEPYKEPRREPRQSISDQVHNISTEPSAKHRAIDTEDPVEAAMAIAWKLAAAISVTSALAVLTLVAAGAQGVAGNVPILAVTVSAILLGPLCWNMSERRATDPRLVHALAIVALSVITIGGFFAGPSSAAGADLYLLTVFVFVFVLSVRAALVYGAFVFIAYTYFVISGSYDEAFVRIASTTVVVLLISSVIGLSRMGTVNATKTHRQLSQVDALTGLPNLRQLRVRLDSEIHRCNVTGESFALVMLDLDNFKQVNDRYSHSLGDSVLVAVADALRSTARAAEMPARRGGDEFAIVLSGASDSAARVATDRIGAAIAVERMRICPDITPTAGVGWVRWQPGETVDELLQRSDDALHEAKAAPRPAELLSA